MKAAGVSTSRYCRVPDSLQRERVLSKRSKSSLIFPLEKSNIAFDLLTRRQGVIWSLVIWNFPNNERSIFYSHTLRVAIEDIIDILKNINNESRWRIDISILQSSRLCRSGCLVKKIKEVLWFFPLEKSNIAFDLLTRRQGVIWSLVIWNFPNNERSIFYSYTLRVVIEDIIDILKNINNESRWRIDISILQSSRLCRGSFVLSKRSKKFFDFFRWKKSNIAFDLLTRRQV